MPIINFHDNHLSYVSREANKIPETLQKMHGEKTTSLDVSYNSLTTLSGLSKFPNLEILVLDNNLLDDQVEFPAIPSLHTLSINKNKLTDLPSFMGKVKANFRNLRHLSLLGNPACPSPISHSNKDFDDYQRYRYYILHHLPKLHFLDSSPVNENERSEGMIRGRYMNIAHPQLTIDNVSPESEPKYTPLPNSSLKTSSGGVYGKWTQKYNGKNSEGNRFIKNNQL